MKRKKRGKSPYHLTFEDAFNAGAFLVKRKHYPKKPCKECAKTLRLINLLKQSFRQTALDDNLVWYAHKGMRKLYIGPSAK